MTQAARCRLAAQERFSRQAIPGGHEKKNEPAPPGALTLSHVNDAGFWVVTRYLGLSVADGLRTRTVLTTLMGLSGFALTWLAWTLV